MRAADIVTALSFFAAGRSDVFSLKEFHKVIKQLFVDDLPKEMRKGSRFLETAFICLVVRKVALNKICRIFRIRMGTACVRHYNCCKVLGLNRHNLHAEKTVEKLGGFCDSGKKLEYALVKRKKITRALGYFIIPRIIKNG
jgi:hypothetical protein